MEDIGIPEIGLVVLGFLSVPAATITNLGWVILFDTLGWDALVPRIVFVSILPSLTVTVIPAVAAKYIYDTHAALKVSTVIALVTFASIEYVRWTSNSCMVC